MYAAEDKKKFVALSVTEKISCIGGWEIGKEKKKYGEMKGNINGKQNRKKRKED